MSQDDLDSVIALHLLPESDPIELDGIQFCPGRTCQSKCKDLTVNVVQTVCAIAASCT